MKEIKAYVRRRCLNKLVSALEEAGAPGITMVDIHPVGYGYEPNCFEEHFEDTYISVTPICASSLRYRKETFRCMRMKQ